MRAKFKISLMLFIAIGSQFQCLSQNQRNSYLRAEISAYRQGDSKLLKSNQNSSWGFYRIGLVATDTALIKSFYLCIGSEHDTADIMRKKIELVRNNGKLVSKGDTDVEASKYMVYAIVRIRQKDIKSIRKIILYIESKRGQKFTRLEPRRIGI